MSFVVGIDLGTTFTGVAVARVGGSGAMVSLGRRQHVMPSVVWLGPGSNDVAVGDSAVRRMANDPANVVSLFKRDVGSETPWRVGGRDVTIDELIGLVLEHALAKAESEHGGSAERIALTFPASWGPLRQSVLVAGAEAAGIVEPLLVTEPEAAAAFYASERPVPDGALVAVFDFGGGTLDIAVVHRVSGGFELLGNPTGDDELGGSNIDELLFEHVLAQLDTATRSEIESDLAARASLFWACVDAKEALSFDPDVEVACVTDSGRQLVSVHREQLEELIAPLVDRALVVLREGLTAAHVNESELHAVLLVGGTSRVPMIGRHLADSLSCDIAVDTDPKTSVALGAAKLALAELDARSTEESPLATVDLQIAGLGPATLIGRGGYAVVYRARQESLNRDVAVKLITGTGFDLTARRRFELECQTIGGLSEHPNIVNVYQSGVPDDRPAFLVMSYVPGGSYQDALDKGTRLAWPDAIDVGIKVAGALEVAHQAGIFHCDVKPANILLSPHGDPLLADFGLARVAERTGTQSITGLAGTPHFSPPEVFDGVPPAAQRDVYGLAATLHTLITGSPPIEVDSESILALMRSIATDEPEDLRQYGLPGPVADTISKGMAKQTEDRYATAAEFRDALVASTTAPTDTAPTDTAPIEIDKAPVAEPPTRPQPDRRVLAAVLAAVALLVVGLLVVRPWGSDADEVATSRPPDASQVVVTSSEPATTSVPATTAEPATTTIEATVPVPPILGIQRGSEFATGPNSWTALLANDLLWAPHVGGMTIIDPQAGVKLLTTPIPGNPETPAFIDDRVWVPNTSAPTLTVLDATNDVGAVIAVLSVGQRGFKPVASGGFVWVPNRDDGTVSRVDPDTFEVQTLPVAEQLGFLTPFGDGVESTVDGVRYVVSVDGSVTTTDPVDPGPAEYRTAQSQWIAEKDRLIRLDPDTGQETGSIEVAYTSVVAAERGLWLTLRGNEPSLMFLDELTLELFTEPLRSNPDTPVLFENRPFVSLIGGGAVAEFDLLS